MAVQDGVPAPVPRIPRIHRALVATGPGALALKPVPVPAIEPDEVLIRVGAVALNPSDHKLLDQSTTVGAVSGADLAGTVVRLGDRVTKLKIGDRVIGFTFGANPGNPGNGAFSQYVASLAGICVPIPDDMDFVTAASLPMGIFTVGFVFRSLGLEFSLDGEGRAKGRGEYVLVQGGATATGTVALQMLKMAGYTPIATCSPASFDLARDRGAVAVFDYNSATVRDDIRDFTRGTLALALDCISTPDTMALCYGAIGDAGGRYAALEQYPRNLTIRRRDVQHDWILGWTILGKEVMLAGAYHRDATPEDRTYGEAWADKMMELLASGKPRTHPLKVCKGGLAAIPSGLDSMRKGLVKGKKLVYWV
ncbi:hypothetical protein N8I77_005014 [Diaporthe amygdali]|uniref:Enoyl reductase (ER) domain-containing protein n=1 Tax=Phomopsis amygdali TaxID=1214568 RepID=A0AAD9SNI7_PHOAM|nr:hypothetical protein N8I77_005014 [Diaporthe amygdali]